MYNKEEYKEILDYFKQDLELVYDEIKSLLARQVSSAVRWRETMERMLADGVDTFIEIGPGKTLAGFLKKMNRDVNVVNIGKTEEMEAFLASRP